MDLIFYSRIFHRNTTAEVLDLEALQGDFFPIWNVHTDLETNDGERRKLF